jgi:hypothetical protein
MGIAVVTATGVALVDGDAARGTVLAEDVRCLARDSDGGLWAGVAEDGVRRSTDGGATWTHEGLDGVPVRSLAFGPGRVYAGVRPARVWARDLDGDWEALGAFPGHRSWWWFSPAEPPFRAYVLGLAVSPHDPGVVLAGIEAGAVLRSGDGGRTWSGHRPGASRDCHGIWYAHGVAYALGGTGGLARSLDDGRTWQRSTRGLAGRYGWSAASDPADPETVYLVTAGLRAHSGNARAFVYRWQARRWRPLLGPFRSLPRVATSKGPDEVLVAADDGALLRSRDRGDTWEALPDRLDGPTRALVVL